MPRTRLAAASPQPTPAPTPNPTPALGSIPPLTPEDIRKMIADGLAATLGNQPTPINFSSSASGTAEETTTVIPRKCTYKDFINCQPTYYKGTEGANALSH